MNTKSNRRGSGRQKCAVPVEGKKGTAFANLQTVDISHGGIGFLSAKALPLHKTIVVQLDLNPDGDPALVIGQIKWIHKLPDSEHYRVGMHFTDDLSSGSKGRLKKFLPR